MGKDVYGEKFNTPVGRFSYPHVFKKAQGMDGAEGKYEVTLLIPKTTDIADLKKRLEEVGKEAFGAAWKGVEKQKNPTIRDGDEIANEKKAEGKDGETFRGNWVVRPRTSRRPGVVGPDKRPIEDEEQIYGGCWGRLNVTPGSYNTSGNKGVTLYLNAVQKAKDDEAFGGGRVDPDSVFEAMEAPAASGAGSDDNW